MKRRPTKKWSYTYGTLASFPARSIQVGEACPHCSQPVREVLTSAPPRCPACRGFLGPSLADPEPDSKDCRPVLLDDRGIERLAWFLDCSPEEIRAEVQVVNGIPILRSDSLLTIARLGMLREVARIRRRNGVTV